MLLHLHLQTCLNPQLLIFLALVLRSFNSLNLKAVELMSIKVLVKILQMRLRKPLVPPIIEDWVSDCDEDESEVMVSNNVKHKSELKPDQAKQPRKINENSRNNRTNWNEKKTHKLGVGFQFTKKAYFLCGSFNHLIKDYDFHDKKMVQKPVMNNVQKGTGQREVRPVWNNALRTNHQNFSNSRINFAPTTVLTKSGIVPISTARQSSSRAAAPLSAARPINTAAPKLFVNVAKTKPNVFQKAHSLSRRPFNQQTTLNNRSLNNKVNTAKVNSVNTAKGKRGDPQVALKDTRIFDSECTRHMTGNKSYLTYYQDYDGGFVAFAGSSKGGRITGKCKIRTGKLNFEDVYFVKELKFNLFSVSQMCDKKNSVLFTETECLILSHDFKLPDENQATNDESNMWHRRLGHINFKTMNKLVKGNLVRVSQPLQILHMDLFGPTFVKSIMGKMYCLVVTDDYSRFSWVFFLAKKDETSGILKDFITGIENPLNHKVKIIRCDNRTEFKNYDMNQFCRIKGIKREFSNARTPQQNKVAERKNRTLRQLEICWQIHYYLYHFGLKQLILLVIYRIGCPITILNTLDNLGKFDGKADEGFLVSYSINSKAFRVFNSSTRKVEKNLHVNFLENNPNVTGSGPE
ncbi:putative ribonuclease H-like domain-containing protein [Tanacetum coccineum]